jgi:hypothetical protein
MRLQFNPARGSAKPHSGPVAAASIQPGASGAAGAGSQPVSLQFNPRRAGRGRDRHAARSDASGMLAGVTCKTMPAV